ncbi:hypothetical protein NW112_09640 [Staphylococcus pettenkoferi]|uniref:Uncharacterized protein n=1 Tax=Staphylococcus pettenkoferi TaxID=170573 RepID=A0A9Q4H0B5_9STAP|nr:hypothetical protein [Staphylococcus pettenkoferi]
MSNSIDYQKGYEKAQIERRIQKELKDKPKILRLYNFGKNNLYKFNKVLNRRSKKFEEGYRKGLNQS